jgi:hypothetical protein
VPKPFYNEVTMKAEGETFRLVINFRALDAIETLLDRPFDTVLEELSSGNQKLGLVGKVLWGLLREHHAEMTLDETASLMFGETGQAAGLAVHQLLNAAFPTGEKAKGKNPPRRRGASKLS